MGAQTLLKLANVESAYGPIRAIRGVSLQVIRGQIATVLGSNGAGKSTILKTISGIIDPRRGSIEFKGAAITAMDPSTSVQRGLSHVPEGREVFPLLSVRDNLLMGAYTRKDRDAVGRDIDLAGEHRLGNCIHHGCGSEGCAFRRPPSCQSIASIVAHHPHGNPRHIFSPFFFGSCRWHTD